MKRNTYDSPLLELKSLLRTHYGSVLCAWVRCFDQNGDGDLSMDEFGEALHRIDGWQGDHSTIWRELVNSALKRQEASVGSTLSVGLAEFDHEDHNLLEGFKAWCTSKFGGPIEMFMRFNNVSGQNEWSWEDFRGICMAHGYEGDARRIFYEALDRGSGKARLQDIMRLENDRLKREVAVNPDLAEALREGRQRYLRLKASRRREKTTQKESVAQLQRQIQKLAGRNFVRGWRRFLDLDGNMSISRNELFKGCRKIAFKGDVWALWRALDTDNDGLWRLEEVDASGAALMARFRLWCWEKFGGCVKALEAISKYANLRLSIQDVEEALRTCGFVPESPSDYRKLHEMLDLEGCGYILAEDVAFLDKWQCQPWLLAEADIQLAETFKAALLNRYPNLLNAWLRALDTDRSNRVCYLEFERAWHMIKMKDRDGAPKAWKALDTDNSGYISLSELDSEAHDELYTFKTWAEGLFGSVHRAFQVLDEDGSKGLTCAEFIRVAKNMGYEGRIKVLFNSLKPEVRTVSGGKDPKITFEDLKFLESWNDFDDDEDDPELIEFEEEPETHKPGRCERCARRHDAWMCNRQAKQKMARGEAPDWAKQLGGDAVAASTLPAVFRVGGCGQPRPARLRRPQESLAYCVSDSEFEILKKIPAMQPGEGIVMKSSPGKSPEKGEPSPKVAELRSPYKVHGDIAKAVRHFEAALDAVMPQRNGAFRQRGSPQKPSGLIKSESLPALRH